MELFSEQHCFFDPSGQYLLKITGNTDFYIKCEATDKDTNQIYSGLWCRRKDIFNSKYFGRIRNICEIQKPSSDPILQKVIAINYNSSDFVVILEKDTLSFCDYIENILPMTENVASRVIFMIAKGIQYLHSNHIVHMNVSHDSLFVVNGELRLGGFEFAKRCKNEECIRTNYGCLNYQAPELFQNQIVNGFKADVWALGVLLYTFISGSVLFDSNTEISSKIINYKFQPEPYFSSVVQELLMKMLDRDPVKRLDINEVLSNPFFSQAAKIYEVFGSPKLPNVYVGQRVSYLNENLIRINSNLKSNFIIEILKRIVNESNDFLLFDPNQQLFSDQTNSIVVYPKDECLDILSKNTIDDNMKNLANKIIYYITFYE